MHQPAPETAASETELEQAVTHALREHPHGPAWVVGFLTSALDGGASADDTARRLRQNTDYEKARVGKCPQ